MPVPDDKRQQAGQRIRAAAAALLAGDIPDGGRCDISTLARQAGVSRATLYRTYPHLKEQFERDMAAAAAGGGHPDPPDAQIAMLKAENAALKTRAAAQRTGANRDWPPNPGFPDSYITPGARASGQPFASIHWDEAITALATPRIGGSGSAISILRIAASLADHHIPVHLACCLGNLDHTNIRLVTNAITRANGGHAA